MMVENREDVLFNSHSYKTPRIYAINRTIIPEVSTSQKSPVRARTPSRSSLFLGQGVAQTPFFARLILEQGCFFNRRMQGFTGLLEGWVHEGCRAYGE